jgi:hypothetical protein
VCSSDLVEWMGLISFQMVHQKWVSVVRIVSHNHAHVVHTMDYRGAHAENVVTRRKS